MRRITRQGIRSAVLAGLAILAAVAVAWAAEGHGATHGGSITHEKLMDLIWRTMNFVALVAILLLTLKKPIANGLARRRQSIIEQFEELEARKDEAERKYREYESRLAQIDAEVTRIVDAAVAQGELEKKRIIDEASRAADEIKRQAERAVQHELTEARRQLRNEIAEQAAAMAEELVKKNLQADDQVKLVEEYLSKVGGSK